VAQWKGVARGYVAVFAIPLVIAVFCNKFLCKFFSSGISRSLGVISFPLYLVQFPVIVSFTSGAIVYQSKRGAISASDVWAIGTMSLAVCFVAAWLFLPVEVFTKWVGDRLVSRLIVRSTAKKIPRYEAV
jgi:peptidoglycan/LPS O-acetylase OafA/YrhL